MCLEIGQNLKQASDWIDQSLKINETPFNLEVKADYFVKNKLPKKALKLYVKSLKIAHDRTPDYKPDRVQRKIAKILNIKTAKSKS